MVGNKILMFTSAATDKPITFVIKGIATGAKAYVDLTYTGGDRGSSGTVGYYAMSAIKRWDVQIAFDPKDPLSEVWMAVDNALTGLMSANMLCIAVDSAELVKVVIGGLIQYPEPPYDFYMIPPGTAEVELHFNAEGY